MDDFEKELKLGFLEEAKQLVSSAEQCFLGLESAPGDQGLLEQIFRIVHNLKGSSRAVGFDGLGQFAHEFENFLIKVKSGEVAADSRTVDLLLRCNDHIRGYVDALRGDFSVRVDGSALVTELVGFVATPEVKRPGEAPAGAPAQAEAPARPVDEEPLSQQTTLRAPVRKAPPATPAEDSIRVNLVKLEKLLDFVGEMVILQTMLREQIWASESSPGVRRTAQQLGKVTKEVHEISMSLRMVPLKQTFQKMQRIVRDTSSVLGKKVELVLEGEETEVDKTVLESLGDPLVHLVRNAVDHGIESPEARRKAGKPEGGRLVLRATHRGGKLVIEIQDDGGGIDGQRLRTKAIEKGIIKPHASLTEQECVELVFAPGFSTKAEVTEISGRGVGMDVVKTNIEALQGEVQVETQVGHGTVFRIVLPLTLAIIDAMIVSLDGERFVIPLSQVQEMVRPDPKDIKETTGLGEVLVLRGEKLPVVRLSRLIGKRQQRAPGSAPEKGQIAVIFRDPPHAYAAMVDDVSGQSQVVIKRLGQEIALNRGFSGSAILGDGKPALILELPDFVRNGRKVA